MLRLIQRLFLFVYYFFYNLVTGKEEWKCDNDAEKKPTKACCTPVQHSTENNHIHHHHHQQQHCLEKESKNFLSTPRPYVDPSKKASWWQWTKECVASGWQKIKNAFSFSSNSRFSSTFAKWIKFIPAQLWRCIKWIFHLILSGLLWILHAFMQIFRSHEASKSEEIPKQYVYKKIESPRDYLNYDDNYAESSFEEKMNDEKTVEENFKNDAKDEITLDNIQKAPEEEAIISPPPHAANAAAAASAVTNFSHGHFTAPESHANQESPISFYARRVSITSTKSGEHRQITPGFSSPPPPAPPPPPPKSAIRIPIAPINTENTKESAEKSLEGAPKGGISVNLPGLMDAAKESMERRRRGRTLSPDNKNKIINSTPAPYRSPSVLGTSSTVTATATTTTNNNRVNGGITSPNSGGVVTRMNAQTPTSDTFLFRPRTQTSRNIETTQKTTEDFFHPDNRSYQQQQQQQRMFSTSPTPSGTFLLGQSVFKPVNEVEKIRDNFNRKCESRGASVTGGGGIYSSRSPSVMSQSYHDGTRDSYTPYRDYESIALRNRFPVQSMAMTSSNDYSPGSYGQISNQKWNLRNNTTNNDDIFNRLPSGGTRRVLERKVTEKHIEKDVDGQVLNGWREQNWMGTYEQFENPNPIL